MVERFPIKSLSKEQMRAMLRVVADVCPVADATCNDPGITFVEAIARMLESEGHEAFSGAKMTT